MFARKLYYNEDSVSVFCMKYRCMSDQSIGICI